MGAEQSVPSKPVPPKICLVPPLIRRRRVRPICANEFLYFGYPTTELLSDWLFDGSTVTTDMVLKPQIRVQAGKTYNPEAVPEITAFMRGGVALPKDVQTFDPAELKKSAMGMLALEARWRNQIRAMVVMEGSETRAPKVYFGLGRENIKGTSFFASFDPRPENAQCDFGLTQAFAYGTLGLSSTVTNKTDLPKIGGWASIRPMPEISLGANIKLDPTPDRGYVADTDFAINVRDSEALIYDRPAYEITFVAKNRGQSYHLSYFQHFVTRRAIRNPLEDHNVTHITNYIDVGAEVSIEQEKMKFGLGGSWQVNKNNLLKGRLSQDNVQASYIFKSWANPAVVLALNSGINFRTGKPMYGLAITCEAALGQPEFERAGANYEEVQVVRYGAEVAPEVNRYDMVNDDSPVLKHYPPQVNVVVPPSSTM